MNYNEIEKLFQDKETLEEVLQLCVDTFNKIDAIGDRLKNRLVNTGEEVYGTLQELNGLYDFLCPIYTIADTTKENEEGRFYGSKKMEIDASGVKFVDATVKKESSIHVNDYRRVRNLLEAYINICKINIGSCQSLLKTYGEYNAQKPLT